VNVVKIKMILRHSKARIVKAKLTLRPFWLEIVPLRPSVSC